MPIEVKNLKHIYSAGTPFEKVALSDISFRVEDGEFVGLIGHTGSGKSTLIQHLNGLLKADSGEIYVDGQNICDKSANMKEIRGKVGIVFQYPEYQLFEETVYKDIAFGPKNQGLSDAEVDERVHHVAQLVGLKEKYLEKSPFDLSGGQKRRVAIAGVLAMKPKVLILDEPAAGLDPVGRDEILRRIKDLHEKEGITVILVSHSMEDIAMFAQKIIVMSDGELKMFDTVENIFARSAELSGMGLAVPQACKVMQGLREQGLPVNDKIYTVEKATEEILRYLREVGKC
ncbi:MAG: energy-coupling factor transporter ATPase [Ruminococcaceae bacterium]|nr:energy-coupling factor transporter ATPase [Oscillospiraceae bacterium]